MSRTTVAGTLCSNAENAPRPSAPTRLEFYALLVALVPRFWKD